MAGSAKGLERFREEITCPLCLDIFKEPKILPCQHIYCKVPCLKGLARRSPNPGTITCPECRSVVQIPGNNFDNLPTAFHINRLKEVHETMAGTLSAVDSSDKMCQCSRHQSQSLDLYCESCQQLICRDCIIADRKHVDHEYGYVNEVIASHREDVKRKLCPAKQLEEDLSTAVARISNIKDEVTEQGASLSREIDTAFDALIDVLHEQRQSLKQNVQEIVERKTVALALQEQRLQAAKAEVTHLTETTERAVDSDSDVKFLSHKGEATAKLEKITQQISHLSLDPVDRPSIGVQITLPGEMRKLFKSSSFTYLYNADPLKCTAMGDCLHRAETDRMTSLTVRLADSQGHPCIGIQNIIAELKSVRDGTITPVEITARPTSCCEVSFKPERRGRHKLSVKVNGIHITNSPFSVFIMKPPQQMSIPLVDTAFQKPTCVTYNDGKLYLSDFHNGTVMIIKKVQIIIGELYSPGEIAIDQHSNIYVCTSGDHKLHKYTKDGIHLKSVGGYGTAPGWFDTPNGIHVSRDDKLFVSDSENHRIQVFDTDLNSLKVIGKKGSRNGQFNCPDGIAFDTSGVMYIVDTLNHRVQVLTQDGKYLRTIGKKGSAPGELQAPGAITIIDDIMYITELVNNRVSVFHTSGRFITTFGEGHLRGPEGITVDEDGFVYITSGRSNVVVF